jgi:roadblock/LC7 domain-containing protein
LGIYHEAKDVEVRHIDGSGQHRAVGLNDFNPTGWLPMRSWIYSGGDYVLAVAGDQFLIAERTRIGSLDELTSLLGSEQA